MLQSICDSRQLEESREDKIEDVQARMLDQFFCEEGKIGATIGHRIGRDGVEIHFLNGGQNTVYLTDGE